MAEARRATLAERGHALLRVGRREDLEEERPLAFPSSRSAAIARLMARTATAGSAASSSARPAPGKRGARLRDGGRGRAAGLGRVDRRAEQDHRLGGPHADPPRRRWVAPAPASARVGPPAPRTARPGRRRRGRRRARHLEPASHRMRLHRCDDRLRSASQRPSARPSRRRASIPSPPTRAVLRTPRGLAPRGTPSPPSR